MTDKSSAWAWDRGKNTPWSHRKEVVLDKAIIKVFKV
jgi:hypothetical protein